MEPLHPESCCARHSGLHTWPGIWVVFRLAPGFTRLTLVFSRLPSTSRRQCPGDSDRVIHADSRDAIVYLHLFSGEQQRIFNNA
jgi:hypothetical protein